MWKFLIFQTKGYRILEVAIILGAISGASIAYIQSILYARLIDKLIAKAYDEVIRMTIIMIIAIWGMQMLYALCNQILEHFVYPSRDETKKRMAQKAFSLAYDELEKEENLIAFRRVQNGEMSSGTLDIQLRRIYEFFTESVKVVFATSFLVILVVQASVHHNQNMWHIAGMTILLFLAFALSFRVNIKIAKKIGKRQVELQKENERNNATGAYLSQLINSESMAKDIRLFGMYDYLCEKCRENLKVVQVFTDFGAFEGRNNAKFSFVMQLLAGCIYVYVAFIALTGTITIGQVLMYAGAIITMMASLQKILTSYQEINYCHEYLKTYEAFIAKPNRQYEGTLPIEKRDDCDYELSFHEVSFRYPGTEQYILKGVNLNFTVGKKVALVGMNGAGKTTLIKLLLRLYEPTEGEIRLNGIDIRKYDEEEYLRIFSVVFQDFKLFDFPLEENIASGQSIDDERMKKVIDQVGLSDLVDRLPQKEKTKLYHENGEGVALSGGEAQKVAIARALYKDAPFIILDEPTAALDPIAEAEIYEKLDTLVGNKTAIFISHRMSSCKFCDHIVVLNEGEIIEEGNHEKLVERNGIYAQLYQTQAAYYTA